jgi:hypothetical protein
MINHDSSTGDSMLSDTLVHFLPITSTIRVGKWRVSGLRAWSLLKRVSLTNRRWGKSIMTDVQPVTWLVTLTNSFIQIGP